MVEVATRPSASVKAGLRGLDRETPISLLVVAQFYWPELIGSAPYCTEAAEWFAARGAQVDVLAARPHHPSTAAFPDYLDGARDREVVAGCRIARVSVRERSGSGAKARIRSELSFFRGGLGLLAKRRVPKRDRVIAFCPSMLSLLLGRLACKRGGRLVGVVHDIQSGLAAGLGMGGAGLVSAMRLSCGTITGAEPLSPAQSRAGSGAL